MSGYHVEWKSGKRAYAKTHQRHTIHRAPTRSQIELDHTAVTNSAASAVKPQAQRIDASTSTITPDLNLSRKSSVKQREELLPPCDTLIMRNGQLIKAKVAEIGINDIRYKECDFPEGPDYIVRKGDVTMIAFANGQRTVITPDGRPVEKIQTGDKQVEVVSVLSFACALLGLGLLLVFGWPFLLGTAALVLGIVGLSIHSKDPQRWSGKGFAIAGIIIGSLVIVAFWVLLFLVILFVATFGWWWWN